MSESRRPGAGPILLLALGIIASTVVAWLLPHSAWLALVGPAIMAAALVGASALFPRPHGVRRTAIRQAVILGVALLVAGVIVIRKDPALLAPLLPILGGGAAAIVATTALRDTTSG